VLVRGRSSQLAQGTGILLRARLHARVAALLVDAGLAERPQSLSTPLQRCRARRITRIVELIVETAYPSFNLIAANSHIRSFVISFSRRPASLFAGSQITLMLSRNQSQLLRTVCSKVAFAHGSRRLWQKSASVGTAFFSRIPTSPFASDVRWAASICRATL